jgi:hypothetical protein
MRNWSVRSTPIICFRRSESLRLSSTRGSSLLVVKEMASLGADDPAYRFKGLVGLMAEAEMAAGLLSLLKTTCLSWHGHSNHQSAGSGPSLKPETSISCQ